jgi:translation initiation factor IF-1
MGKKNKTTDETTDERADYVELEGVIDEALPGTMFKVRCDNGHMVLATLSGRLRINHIRLLPGDIVKVHVSPYDLSRGRVVYRGKALT